MLNIAVLIKQIPLIEDANFDPATKTIKRDGPNVISAFDLRAVVARDGSENSPRRRYHRHHSGSTAGARVAGAGARDGDGPRRSYH